MAPPQPNKRKPSGAAPLPISALPLPDSAPTEQESPPEPSLPTGSTGELSPAQRARLGLDVYGENRPQAPATPEPTNQGPSTLPVPPSEPTISPPASQTTSDFDFAAMDPPAPRLAPVNNEPRLAPAEAPRLQPATAAAQRRQREEEEEKVQRNRRGTRGEEMTVGERDGMPEVERDRSILGYGVAWTAFCLVFAAVVSAVNIGADANLGPTPGAFVPAMISIVLGWIVVAIGYRMTQWGWLMIVPAVVLVLGPFVYTNWRIGQLETETRAYLSSQGGSAAIDVDGGSVLTSTINTDAGCFALVRTRSSGDVRVDVVTAQPATAQQQASMAMAPRFARRVPPGGDRTTQRTFTMAGGKLPVVVVAQSAPPIDCAGAAPAPTEP
jgi:hypothetical protein